MPTSDVGTILVPQLGGTASVYEPESLRIRPTTSMTCRNLVVEGRYARGAMGGRRPTRLVP